MKKILLPFLLCFTAFAFGQAPQKLNYQAVARDATGNVLPNHSIAVELSVLDSISTGTALYVETHSATTNQFGLFTVFIGSGTPLSGNFAAIPWAVNDKFLKVGLDISGGSNFQWMGTSQLVSVPYALWADNANVHLNAGAGIQIQNNAGQYTISNTALGSTGPTGSNGLPGATGATGANGLNGTNGSNGLTGATGPSGVQGATGAAGVDGTNGLNGPTGATGPTGADGAISGWALLGNAGTNTNNFVGTTDAQPLRLKVNNTLSGYIHPISGNNFFGLNAGNEGMSGGANSAFGDSALHVNTSGHNNTAMGFGALTSNTIGSTNDAFGYYTLYHNTTGSTNSAFGNYALFSNTTGIANTACGTALFQNITGNNNTAMGLGAMFQNRSGSFNTSVGYQAMYRDSVGHFNTAVGAVALYYNKSGSYNIAIGQGALPNNGQGSYNTVVGNQADAGIDNSVAIGYYALCDSSNKVVIGNTANISIGGQVGWTVFSDERVKQNVAHNVPGMQFISQLQPVTYHYNVAKEKQLLGISGDTMEWPGKHRIDQMTFSGFMAQQVDAAANNIGYAFSGVDKNGRIWGLRYADFVPSMVQGMQEQQQMIDELKKEIAELKEVVERMKK